MNDYSKAETISKQTINQSIKFTFYKQVKKNQQLNKFKKHAQKNMNYQ